MQTLRPYQSEGLARVFAAWREGARSVLMVLPTGGGKTSMFSYVLAQIVAAGRRGLLVVHRRELATQGATRLTEFGVDFGYVMAGMPRNECARMQIASVQTLVRRQLPGADLVVCDEAHLSTASTWQTVLKEYPRARILGVTATPWRLSGKPLAGLYDACIVVTTPRELREQGYLSPYVGFSYKAPDLSQIKTTGGDYNDKQSAEAMGGTLIVDNIVDEYGKHAHDLSAVCFAVTVEHSLQLAARFQAAGVRAEHLDGNTPRLQRDDILGRVARGETSVLCNVGVAVEGLDIPRLKCCILARPTQSLSRAIQMMGRVRRPWNGIAARIHDHAFNIGTHGRPDDERDYQLNAASENPPSLSTCEVCRAIFTGRVCPSCAHENAKAAADRTFETVADAEKIEFDSEVPLDQPTARPPIDVQWNDAGRKLEGQIKNRWTEQTRYGLRPFFLVEGKKRRYTFSAPSDLKRKLDAVPDGAHVWIEYLGEKFISEARVRKEFRVEVDDGT